MAEQPTCGQGIAVHAELPTRLGILVAALAEVLEAHMPALDLTDPNAQLEHEVYARLARQHREIADRLRAVAADMAAQRDLPMGRHNVHVITSSAPAEALRAYVQAERTLLDLLEQSAAQSEQMLAEINHGGPLS